MEKEPPTVTIANQAKVVEAHASHIIAYQNNEGLIFKGEDGKDGQEVWIDIFKLKK